jgi:hypothetical protein
MKVFRNGARCFLVLVAPALSWGTNYISVQSGGQSFVVDTDSEKVQKNLKPANPQAGESKLPAWLFPYAGAQPTRPEYDVQTGMASASFATGGTVEQTVAYYAQLFASKGFAGGSPMGSPTSRIVSARKAGGLVSALVTSPPFGPQAGTVQLKVTNLPAADASAKKHFESAWYDDGRGLLCLRDTATGEEYYLDRRGILEANLNRPGGVVSTGAAVPTWLPRYPNAHSAKIKLFGMSDATATFRTPDSIRAVYQYYLAAVQNAGAHVVSNGITQSGKPPKDFDAHVTAQLGGDVVEIGIGEIFSMSFPVPFSEPATGTAIGIRYSVPKQ